MNLNRCLLMATVVVLSQPSFVMSQVCPDLNSYPAIPQGNVSSQAKTAATLTRPTALALVQSAAPKLLEERTYLQASRLLVLNADYQNDRLRYADAQAAPFTRAAALSRLEFLQLLVRADLFTMTSEPATGELLSFRKAPGTQYTFACKPGLRACSASDSQTLRLVTHVPLFQEITGIRQEGSTAIVETAVAFEATGIQRCVNSLLADWTDDGKRGLPTGLNTSFNEWPLNDPPPAARSFTFSRYDDGWRLAR